MIGRTFHNNKGNIMNTKAKHTLHPMILSACVAVLFFSAIGIAAIMGWIPGSFARNADTSEVASAAAPATQKDAQGLRPASESQSAPARTASAVKAICSSCGVIESTRMIETNGQASGIGAVGGAVVGGLLGNQVGGGNGKKAMTVVGAVGGALAGNHIEKRVNTTTTFEVLVRMNNGSSRTIYESVQPVWRKGDRVKIVDGGIRAA
jgi:outer membrane lipoprotein SlyB